MVASDDGLETSPDMRTKYEKNQNFPLAISAQSSKQSKVLESLRENYGEHMLAQTSGSSTRKFEEFLNEQDEMKRKAEVHGRLVDPTASQ